MTTQRTFTKATENGTETIDLADLTTQELRDLRSDAGAHGDHEAVDLINAELDDRNIGPLTLIEWTDSYSLEQVVGGDVVAHKVGTRLECEAKAAELLGAAPRWEDSSDLMWPDQPGYVAEYTAR